MGRLKYVAVILFFASSFLYPEGEGYRKWFSGRESLRQDPAVTRYYTFEDVKDKNSIVKDLKNSGADLLFVPFKEGDRSFEDLKVIDGRVEGKKAVRLDGGYYRGPALDIEGNSFTVSVWFRRQGPGSIPSSGGGQGGNLVCVDGWERGWGIATSYDKINTIRFGLGHPGGSYRVTSDISVPDNLWHHFAAVWDGGHMQIYLNGVLAGKYEYSGPYTPSSSGDFLVIGNDGGPAGNVVLDMDEIAFFNRALKLGEIRKLAIASQGVMPEILAAAEKLLMSGDYSWARRQYERLKSMESVEYAREVALLNMAESYRMEKNYAGARRTYGELMGLPGLTDNYRIYSMFREAGLYCEQKDYTGARKIYGEIKKVKGVKENDLFRSELSIADTYRQELVYSKAVPYYLRLLKEIETSAFPHENQRLEVVDRIEATEGMKDGQVEKSFAEKLADLVKKPGLGIYVSTVGNDADGGTLEKPFRTIERARQEVRRIKGKGMPEGGIAVYLRGGKYFVTGSVEFGEEDSGTESSPVVYRSYPGEDARIIGGKEVSGFMPVRDTKVLSVLPAESKGKVLVCDLKKEGINDFGKMLNRGSGGGDFPSAMELFYNGSLMQVSRWPNDGWLFVHDLLTPGGDGGSGEETFQKGRFRYTGDRPARWKEENDLWTVGYFNWPWDKFHLQVTGIDTVNRIINLAPNINYAKSYPLYDAPVRRDKPHYFYNILNEIDMPGEFYVDRKEGLLYFYPPKEIGKGDEIMVSILETPILKVVNASNMVFYGLTLECTRLDAIKISEGRNNLVAGCRIRNIGRSGVTIDGGFRHCVAGSDISDIGGAGIRLSGGNWKKLIPSRHLVENNYICRFNRLGGGPGVSVMGIGNRVSHNLITDTPHQAIVFDYNNHVIEYNEIYDVVSEAKDAGVIYIYGAQKSFVNRGNVIRYNFIHHITEHSSVVPYVNPGITGLYIDALNGGITMKGNIFYRNTGTAIFTHGPDSRVEDNIFVDNSLDIYQGNRNYLLVNPDRVRMWKNNVLESISYRQPPWSSRYPQLPSILEKGKNANAQWNPAWPRNVFIERNISVGGRFLKVIDGLTDEITIRDNLEGYDPVFRDTEKLDFGLMPGSPVYGITGQEPVPFEKIGLYQDPLRASWPVKRLPPGKYYKPEKVAVLPPVRFNFNPLPQGISPAPVYGVKRRISDIRLDGKLDADEWNGSDKSKALIVEKNIGKNAEEGNKSYLWMSYDDRYLYIAIENEPDPVKHATTDEERKKGLGTSFNEVCIEGKYTRKTWWWDRSVNLGPVFVFDAYSDGRIKVHNIFGMPEKDLDNIVNTLIYKAFVIDAASHHWTSEWRIPLSSLSMSPVLPDTARFNMASAKTGGLWFAWVVPGGSIWRLDNGGTIKFEK